MKEESKLQNAEGPAPGDSDEDSIREVERLLSDLESVGVDESGAIEAFDDEASDAELEYAEFVGDELAGQNAGPEPAWSYSGPFGVRIMGGQVVVNAGRAFVGGGLPVTVAAATLAWGGGEAWVVLEVTASGVFGSHVTGASLGVEFSLSGSAAGVVRIWLGSITAAGVFEQWQFGDVYVPLWRYVDGVADVVSVGLQTPVCCPGPHTHGYKYEEFKAGDDVCDVGSCVADFMCDPCGGLVLSGACCS